MAFELTYAPGATPLDPDEIEGLIPKDLISTVGQLNAFEQENILDAYGWLDSKPPAEILDDVFLRELHARMLSKTWRWAGAYRKTERNIGVEPEQIAVSVRNLAEDFKLQLLHRKGTSVDEIAMRFHHRLVAVHAFPNGNGRHARLATDLLLELHGVERFTWGSENLCGDSEVRGTYIDALRKADQRVFDPLMAFVRS